MAKKSAASIRASGNKPEIIITIKGGQMEIDQVGFVGMDCVGDAVTKELVKLGRVTERKRKPKIDKRPVHDVAVIEAGLG